jgi:hypothetical protein
VFFIPVDEEDEGAGVKLAPEPQRNGVAFCAGDFHSAGAELTFGYPIPPPEILPGVTLNAVDFDFQLQKPVLFDGSATIKAAELVTAKGGFLAAFATPDHQYTFQPGDAGGTLKPLSGKSYSSTTIAIGGSVFIKPEEEVELELGSAYLLYSYPDYIKARGSAHLQTFLFAINAAAEFELSARTRKFNALLEGQVCLAGGSRSPASAPASVAKRGSPAAASRSASTSATATGPPASAMSTGSSRSSSWGRSATAASRATSGSRTSAAGSRRAPRRSSRSASRWCRGRRRRRSN